MSEITEPCPFCGGEGAARSTLDTPAYWFGICLSCEAMTGYSTSEEGAAIVWNLRHERAPSDEGAITDQQINAAIRHGFGDRFADDVDDPCGIRKSITDDQFENLFVALHRIKCNPSMDEIALVMPEVVAILQPDVLRDRIAVLERENRNYAKTMDIIGLADSFSQKLKPTLGDSAPSEQEKPVAVAHVDEPLPIGDAEAAQVLDRHPTKGQAELIRAGAHASAITNHAVDCTDLAAPTSETDQLGGVGV